MAGRANWAEQARVYTTKRKSPQEEQEERENQALKRIGKGILAGLVIGGGIEAFLDIVPGIQEVWYCSKSDICYRIISETVAAALILPIEAEKREENNYFRKACCYGIGYVAGAAIAYSTLEVLTKI